MKTVYLIALLTFVLPFSVSAASSDTTFWRSEAALVSLEDADTSGEDAIILTDNRMVVYSAKYRKITRHRIVHILSAEGLDAHNKVAVYVPGEGSISDLKARSISASGTIVELTENNIKDITNYDENANLKIFAIEGAEVGGQIEYTYTLQTPVYDSGIEELSKSHPTRHAFLMICSGDGITIGSKAYNWSYDDKKSSTKHTYLFKNIIPLKEESYTTPEANSPFVEYKVTGSQYGESLYSKYAYIVRKMYADFNDFDATHKRKLNSFMKHFEGESSNQRETLMNLNAFLKSRFYYEENYSPEYSDVMSVIKNKVGNDLGLTKLYCLILSELGIQFEVVVTCNKYELWFDPEYCSRFYLNEYLIYFPLYNTYIYPPAQTAHFGIVPYWLDGNTGVVISQFKKNPQFRLIESSSPEKDQTNLRIGVDLNLLDNHSVIEVDGFGTGQIAYDYNTNSYYSESEEEKTKSFREIIEWRYPDCEILSAEMINPAIWGDMSACEDYACKREFKASIKSHSLFEKTGSKILVNVGKLIGPQSELYTDEARVQKITQDRNESYTFNIVVNIPEGYKYSGNQNVEIENVYTDSEGRKAAGFKSTLTADEKTVTISIYEYYSALNIPKESYENYRKVINSAANFNKSTILLEKI